MEVWFGPIGNEDEDENKDKNENKNKNKAKDKAKDKAKNGSENLLVSGHLDPYLLRKFMYKRQSGWPLFLRMAYEGDNTHLRVMPFQRAQTIRYAGRRRSRPTPEEFVVNVIDDIIKTEANLVTCYGDCSFLGTDDDIVEGIIMKTKRRVSKLVFINLKRRHCDDGDRLEFSFIADARIKNEELILQRSQEALEEILLEKMMRNPLIKKEVTDAIKDLKSFILQNAEKLTMTE